MATENHRRLRPQGSAPFIALTTINSVETRVLGRAGFRSGRFVGHSDNTNRTREAFAL